MSEVENRKLMQDIVSASSEIPTFKIPFSIPLLVSMQSTLASTLGDKYNLSYKLVIGSAAYTAVHSDTNFVQMFDPETKLDTVQAGLLGTVLGMDTYYDGFFHPMTRIVAVDNIYMAAVNKKNGEVIKSLGLTLFN